MERAARIVEAERPRVDAEMVRREALQRLAHARARRLLLFARLATLILVGRSSHGVVIAARPHTYDRSELRLNTVGGPRAPALSLAD